MKIRVANLVDKYLERHKKPCRVIETIYEYEFGPVLTCLGVRPYVADIFVDTFKPEKPEHRKRMQIECDGPVGHDGKWNQMNDRVRDENILDKFECKVIRLRVFWLKSMTDQEILDYIEEQFNLSKLLR